MEDKKLYHVPKILECEGDALFEGDESVSIADKNFDADYWITLSYVTADQKVFKLEVATMKKSLGPEFFEEFTELVAKHAKID